MEKGKFYEYNSGQCNIIMDWKMWFEYRHEYIDVHMAYNEGWGIACEEKNINIFYEYLNSLDQPIFEKIGKAVVALYKEDRQIFEENREDCPDKTVIWDDFIFEMPKDIEPLEIFKYLTDFTIRVYEPENGNRVVDLGCNMAWEIEHGLDICIVGDEVVYLTTSGGGFNPYNQESIDFYRDKDYNYATLI